MAIEWIKAPLALKYASLGEYDYPSRIRICERAHSGLIDAKAEKVIWDGQESRNKILPKGFWWAEGNEALEQDWESGDFSTWIDDKFEIKVFGISFDFLAITDLVSADNQAKAMRAISVIAKDDWITAKDLQDLIFSNGRQSRTEESITEACRIGQIAGRAMRANGEGNSRGTVREGSKPWAAIEWDIPLWFWRNFTDPSKSNQDWQMGTATGRGKGPSGPDFIKLQGIHFHRSGLVNIGLGSTQEVVAEDSQSKRGRKPTYDWPSASSAIWGQIYRGELIPENQAQIEKAIQSHLATKTKEPSESTVRPHAKIIWDEFAKA